MKRISLAVLVLGVTVAACSEVATSPETVNPPLSFLSNPPPPDVDTMAAGTADGQMHTFRVRYFFNTVGNAGWLKFDSEQGDVSVDKNAQVRYSQGVFSGKGFLTLTDGAGELVVDLSTVSQTSSFTSCTVAETAPSATEDTRPEGGCFSLSFSGVTRNDLPTRSPFVLVPGCEGGRLGEIIPCVTPPPEEDPPT